MTAVRDTVYKSDGSLASGTVVITWRPFVTADSKPVFGGTKTVPLSNGALAVALVPNQGGIPSGTSYNVKYYQSGNVFSEETWVVPSSSALPSPGAPTVANIGTPGSTTYYYWVSAKNANGETLLGPSAVTTTSNSTLDGTNYNQISWSGVAGATNYRVWRTTTPTAPSGTGNYLVGETAATSINDQSNSLQQATIPSLNDTDPRTLADVRVTAAPSSTVTLAASQVSGTAIVSNPSGTQTISAPQKAGVIPLQIKGALQDNSNILEIYDSQSQPALQSWFNSGGAFLTAKSDTGAGDLYGIRSNISSSNSSGARTLASAMESKATHNAAGTLTEMAGFLARTNVRSAGTVTNNYGLRVESQQRVSATAANNWDLHVGNPRSDFNATSQYYIDTAGSIFTMKKSSSDGGAKLVGLTAVAEDTTNDSQIVGMEAHAEIAHGSGNKGISLGSYADARSSGGGNSDLIAGSAFWAEQAGTGTIADMASLWIIGNARYAGTVNNSYGILVSNVAGVGTNSWAIKTGTGKVQFGDDVVAPTINSIRYADQFAGADAGAKIAAAIADLPSTGGIVDARGFEGSHTLSAFTISKANVTVLFGPGAIYTISGTIINKAQNVWLHFGGSPVASTVNGDAIKIDGSTATGSTTLMDSPYLNGGITGLHLTGNSGANAVGIHQVDVIGFVYDDVAVVGFNGTNGTGIWVDNQAGATGGFSEKTSFRKVVFRDNKKGLRMSQNGGIASVMYTMMSETLFNVIDGQIGFSVENVELFNSQIHFMANVDDPVTPGTLLQVSGGGIIKGGRLDILAEQTTGSGGVGIKVADTSSYILADGTLTLTGGLTNSTPTITAAVGWPYGRYLFNYQPLSIVDPDVISQRQTQLSLGSGGATFALPSYAGVGNDGAFQIYARDTGDNTPNVSQTVYPPAFTGSGLNDMTSGGEHAVASNDTYTIVIDGTGSPNTFKWKKGAGSYTTGVNITGSAQTLSAGVTVTFAATTGHTLNDQWDFYVGAAKVPLLYVDSLGKKVGIGTTSPAVKLDVNGAIRSTMMTVAFSATPTFDASLGNSFKITLAGNVTSSTLSNAVTGQTISFLLCQNAGGGNTFVWPTNVLGGMTISGTGSKCNAQTFLYDGTNAYALSSGVTGM